MENLTDLLKVHLRAAWRRKWYALAVLWLVCILGWVVLSRLPDQYEVSAKLHVDTDAVLVPLLRGLAVDTATASQAELMQKTLLSRTNLQKLVAMSYPEVAEGPEAERERLSQRLALAIQISSVGRQLFALTYRDSNPETAYNVIKGALTIFVDNQADAVRTDMDTAQRFLRGQIATYEVQLSEVEKRRVDFRTQYFDLLPGENNAPSRLQVARETLAKLEADYADAQLRVNALKRELETIPQFLSVNGINVVNAGVVTSLTPAQQQLFDAERNLKLLKLRLTDEHPDVIAARRLLSMLQGTSGDTATTAGRNISNTVYEQVRLQIVEREINSASLSGKIATAREETERLEKLARDAPGVDAEYVRLNRDYAVLQKNYNELVARLEQARIAEAANTTTDNKVHLVDPPQLPKVPVAPKRLLLISAVLAAGFGAGVGVIVLFEQLDRSFKSLNSLLRLHAPVLGSISQIKARSPFRHWFAASGLAVGVLLLLLVYGHLMIRASGVSLVI